MFPTPLSLRALALGSILLLAGASPMPNSRTATTTRATTTARSATTARATTTSRTATTSRATTTRAAEPARYFDPTYRISMAVPAFPVAQERAVIATFQGPSEDGFSSNVTLVEDPGATTRERYIQAFKDQIKETNPRFSMRDPENLQVSGKNAAILEYEFSEGGRRLHFLQLAVFAEDRVHILTCTAPAATFTNYEGAFRKCVESFRLEK
jgi:hypothetical protein